MFNPGLPPLGRSLLLSGVVRRACLGRPRHLTTTLVAAVLGLALLFVRPAGARVFEPPPPLPVGSKAPAFTTKTIDGKRLTLAELRGHVVLVDFWATWCVPCRMSTPTLERLQRRFGSHGLKIVGLSLDDADSRDQIEPFLQTYHVTYTLAYAPQQNVKTSMRYRINRDPNTGEVFDRPVPPAIFVIDGRGRVRWSQIGYSLDEEQLLSRLITKLLKETGLRDTPRVRKHTTRSRT